MKIYNRSARRFLRFVNNLHFYFDLFVTCIASYYLWLNYGEVAKYRCGEIYLLSAVLIIYNVSRHLEIRHVYNILTMLILAYVVNMLNLFLLHDTVNYCKLHYQLQYPLLWYLRYIIVIKNYIHLMYYFAMLCLRCCSRRKQRKVKQ